jgi:hypothetical protein
MITSGKDRKRGTHKVLPFLNLLMAVERIPDVGCGSLSVKNAQVDNNENTERRKQSSSDLPNATLALCSFFGKY